MNTQAMNKLGYGLYVLSSNADGRDHGCIINTAVQVTENPRRLMIAVNKANFTHGIILRSGEFNLSVLTEETPFDIFQRFGFQSGANVDKFAGFEPVKRSENGILYLTDYSNAVISAAVKTVTDLGTHTMFIADVSFMDVTGDGESVTYSYYHKHIKPAPVKKETGGWRCTICGYVHEGAELPADFICPICKHTADVFEKI